MKNTQLWRIVLGKRSRALRQQLDSWDLLDLLEERSPVLQPRNPRGPGGNRSAILAFNKRDGEGGCFGQQGVQGEQERIDLLLLPNDADERSEGGPKPGQCLLQSLDGRRQLAWNDDGCCCL